LPIELTLGDARVQTALRLLAARRPLVHCLTNFVVGNFTANVLLAVGASPAMVENVAESGEFASVADAVLINLGTLSAEREQAMRAAARSASAHDRPWVLDPVAVSALAHRRRLAIELLAERPSVVRANAAEVLALAGEDVSAHGVDSVVGSGEAVDAATRLARTWGCVVAVSGVVDYVTDGVEIVAVSGGTPMMTRTTGSGCALGALVAAFLPVTTDAMFGAAAASVVFAVAGERAATVATGPGSFGVAFVDALGALSAEAARQ
jgi:hydroxyethylthiazole kinase